MDRRVRLAQVARHLRRIDERHLAEGVEQLYIRECHIRVFILSLCQICHLLSSASSQHLIVNKETVGCNGLQAIVLEPVGREVTIAAWV